MGGLSEVQDESRPCQYQPKRGKLPCKRPARSQEDYCAIHQPLKGEREVCAHCGQLIRKGATAHAKKCSSLSLQTVRLPYYSHNCNLLPSDEAKATFSRDIPVDESELASRIERLYLEHAPNFMDEELIDDFNDDSLSHDNSQSLPPSHKHSCQQQAIVECMKRHGLVDEEPAMYIEFGAGKGSLSKEVASNCENHLSASRFVCIEKSAYKHKAENNAQMHSYRARIDLSDVQLGKLIAHADSCFEKEIEENTNTNVMDIVGIGKHVCGGATDLSFAALRNYSKNIETLCLSGAYSTEKACPVVHRRIKGVAFALCCHGLCSWDSFVGRQWLESVGSISAAEFEYLRRWSGFFVIDKCQSAIEYNQEILSRDELNFSSRARLGKMCKRLLDFGRMHYIKTNLQLRTRLVKFIDSQITPENILLLAFLNKSDTIN